MRTRLVRLSTLIVALLSLMTVSQHGVSADPEKPSCRNPETQQVLVATKWLDAPGTLKGTNGPDVLVGSTGADKIYGYGGDDVICTKPDGIYYDLDVDYVDAGTGHDTVLGTATGTGGPGNDYIYVSNWQSNFTGGSGNDVVWADGAIGDGGSGNDTVFGYHSIKLLGGPGNDWLANMESGLTPPLMDCGSGTDRFVANGATNIRRCERAITFCQFPASVQSAALNAVASADVSLQCH